MKLGLTFMRQWGSTKMAINDYTKALDIEEKNLKTLNELTKGKWHCGIIAYELYDKRAFAYKKMGKYQLAIDDFTKAIECLSDKGPHQWHMQIAAMFIWK